MSDRLKILYVAQHLTMGGAEELLLRVATRLPRERFDVVVGCLTREGVIARELRRAGVRVELIEGAPGLRDPLAFGRLLAFIRAERPHVVHTYLHAAGLYGRLAAWLAGVRTIFHSEQNVYADKSRRHLLLERFLARRTARVIACCRAVGEYYARQVALDQSRLEVIYNAVDFALVEPRADRSAARAELGYGSAEVVLGCVGRLTHQKGHDVLIQALGAIKDQRSEIRLFLAGEGSEQESLARLAVEHGVGERVRFLGVRRDRATLFAAADVFVLPSRWEGLSLALVEAAGAGLPIVVTDVGGNLEVVQSEEHVWVVPPSDRRALAAALAEAVSSEAVSPNGSLGPRKPRQAIHDRFGIAQHLALLEASYRSALGVPPLHGAESGTPAAHSDPKPAASASPGAKFASVPRGTTPQQTSLD